ncbi:hypothetical protein GF354_02075 [Candidatus Peregrinibacteria bacterium]|nr:hypothetical protein [Candidatus Peregrinibacteria bacterium]
MLYNFSLLSVVNRIFNVHPGEWPKILASWSIKFLYRAAFVTGWTVIVALFVSKYGISKLPFLFILNGFFTILGTILYSSILDRIQTKKLMIYTVILACIPLLLSVYIYDFNKNAFFLLLIVAEAVFLTQLKLLIDSFTEKMFTPLQSERTFPLIESSLTMGGILAGLLVVLFSSSLEVYKFTYIWIGLILLQIPALLFYENYFSKISVLVKREVKRSAINLIDKLKIEFARDRHRDFLKGLFLIVLFQWILFNLLEFQYTKAVYNNVSDVVLDAGSGFEHSFVHDLGALFIIFSSTALVVQFFVGGRLINSLGVIGSMLVHPLVTLLSIFGLTVNFGFSSAVLAKNNYTITSVLQNNAYHSAYYAVKENLREHTRELLEGIVRPVGAILGTAILFSLQAIFFGESLVFALNLSMICVICALGAITYLQQRNYSKAAINDLFNEKCKKIRFNAIDILAQKGHRTSAKVLMKVLANEEESVSIRIKIIKALLELNYYKSLPTVLELLKSEKSALREAAVNAIIEFKNISRYLQKHLYLRIQIIEQLKEMYTHEENHRIRVKIINALSMLSYTSTVDYLVHLLDDKAEDLKPEIIYTLGNYRDETLSKLILPYLKSGDDLLEINTAISIGRVKSYLKLAIKKINEFLATKDARKVSLALYAIGELNLKNKRKLCLSYLYSQNLEEKIQASLALAKMGYYDSLPVLVDLIFSSSKDISKDIKERLRNVDVRVFKNIDKIVKQIVSDRVDTFIKNEGNKLSTLDQANLKTLKWLYCLAEEYDEIENINKYIIH